MTKRKKKITRVPNSLDSKRGRQGSPTAPANSPPHSPPPTPTLRSLSPTNLSSRSTTPPPPTITTSPTNSTSISPTPRILPTLPSSPPSKPPSPTIPNTSTATTTPSPTATAIPSPSTTSTPLRSTAGRFIDSMDSEISQISPIIQSFHGIFTCTICLDLAKDPIFTQCNHKFCSPCILSIFKKRSNIQCPLCNAKISKIGLVKRNMVTTIANCVRKLVNAAKEGTNGLLSPPSSQYNATQKSPSGVKLNSSLIKSDKKATEELSNNIPDFSEPLLSSIVEEDFDIPSSWMPSFEKHKNAANHKNYLKKKVTDAESIGEKSPLTPQSKVLSWLNQPDVSQNDLNTSKDCIDTDFPFKDSLGMDVSQLSPSFSKNSEHESKMSDDESLNSESSEKLIGRKLKNKRAVRGLASRKKGANSTVTYPEEFKRSKGRLRSDRGKRKQQNLRLKDVSNFFVPKSSWKTTKEMVKDFHVKSITLNIKPQKSIEKDTVDVIEEPSSNDDDPYKFLASQNVRDFEDTEPKVHPEVLLDDGKSELDDEQGTIVPDSEACSLDIPNLAEGRDNMLNLEPTKSIKITALRTEVNQAKMGDTNEDSHLARENFGERISRDKQESIESDLCDPEKPKMVSLDEEGRGVSPEEENLNAVDANEDPLLLRENFGEEISRDKQESIENEKCEPDKPKMVSLDEEDMEISPEEENEDKVNLNAVEANEDLHLLRENFGEEVCKGKQDSIENEKWIPGKPYIVSLDVEGTEVSPEEENEDGVNAVKAKRKTFCLNIETQDLILASKSDMSTLDQLTALTQEPDSLKKCRIPFNIYGRLEDLPEAIQTEPVCVNCSSVFRLPEMCSDCLRIGNKRDVGTCCDVFEQRVNKNVQVELDDEVIGSISSKKSSQKESEEVPIAKKVKLPIESLTSQQLDDDPQIDSSQEKSEKVTEKFPLEFSSSHSQHSEEDLKIGSSQCVKSTKNNAKTNKFPVTKKIRILSFSQSSDEELSLGTSQEKSNCDTGRRVMRRTRTSAKTSNSMREMLKNKNKCVVSSSEDSVNSYEGAQAIEALLDGTRSSLESSGSELLLQRVEVKGQEPSSSESGCNSKLRRKNLRKTRAKRIRSDSSSDGDDKTLLATSGVKLDSVGSSLKASKRPKVVDQLDFLSSEVSHDENEISSKKDLSSCSTLSGISELDTTNKCNEAEDGLRQEIDALKLQMKSMEELIRNQVINKSHANQPDAKAVSPQKRPNSSPLILSETSDDLPKENNKNTEGSQDLFMSLPQPTPPIHESSPKAEFDSLFDDDFI